MTTIDASAGRRKVHMAELTTTSHAILGLLARRDCTTYELAQEMRRRLHYAWPRAERKLYEEPRRLVEAGYATSVKDMIGRRARTIYSITPEGRQALAAWLKTPIQEPSFEFDGLVRVLFCDQGDAATLRRVLEQIAEQAAEQRRAFEVAIEHNDRKNGLTQHGPGPSQRALVGLASRFMTEHYDHTAQWAQWALGEVDRWRQAAAGDSDASTGAGADAGQTSAQHDGGPAQSEPDTSKAVASIDE